MYGITDLRKDTLIDIDGTPFRVTDYSHTQMGRGGATVRVKVKNLITGQVLEKVYKNDAKVEPANIERAAKQYLYRESSKLAFMDPDTFDQEEVALGLAPEIAKYFAEGSTVQALVYQDRIIGFDLPKNNVLTVSDAPGAARGNTATGATKEVTLETGHKVHTPLFIKSGDRVKIDTRTGAYLERA